MMLDVLTAASKVHCDKPSVCSEIRISFISIEEESVQLY